MRVHERGERGQGERGEGKDGGRARERERRGREREREREEERGIEGDGRVKDKWRKGGEGNIILLDNQKCIGLLNT